MFATGTVVVKATGSALLLKYLLDDSMLQEHYLLHPLFKHVFGQSPESGEIFRWVLAGADFYTNFYRTYDPMYQFFNKIKCNGFKKPRGFQCKSYADLVHILVEICIINASFNYVLAPQSISWIGRDYKIIVGILLALLNYLVSRTFKHHKINQYLARDYGSLRGFLKVYTGVRRSFENFFKSKCCCSASSAFYFSLISLGFYTIFLFFTLCAILGRNFYGTLHAIALSCTNLDPSKEIWTTGVPGKIVVSVTGIFTFISIMNFLYTMLIPLLELVVSRPNGQNEQEFERKNVCKMPPKCCQSLLLTLLYVATVIDTCFGQLIPSWSGDISLMVTIFGQPNSPDNDDVIISLAGISALGYIVCYFGFNLKDLLNDNQSSSRCCSVTPTRDMLEQIIPNIRPDALTSTSDLNLAFN